MKLVIVACAMAFVSIFAFGGYHYDYRCTPTEHEPYGYAIEEHLNVGPIAIGGWDQSRLRLAVPAIYNATSRANLTHYRCVPFDLPMTDDLACVHGMDVQFRIDRRWSVAQAMCYHSVDN